MTNNNDLIVDSEPLSELVANANSKQIIDQFYTYAPDGKSRELILIPDFSARESFNIIREDPIVKAAIISITDKVLESGFRITGIDQKSRRKDLEQKLKELRFNKVLHKAILNLRLFNNAFIEVVKDSSGNVKDLNVLDTVTINIIAKDNGDVKEYRQNNLGRDLKFLPTWQPDQIWHLKLNDIGSNVWAEFDMKTLYETILIKDSIRKWIYWFFKTNQSRGMFNIEEASDKSIRDMISTIKAAEKDPSKPVIIQGKSTFQLLRKFSEEGMSVIQAMEWCDAQILSLLQVPPIAIGKMDVSGRSNSVEAYSSLATTVYSIQQSIEDDITYDLFPKMGFEKCLFNFGVLDYVNEEKVFKIIDLMKKSGFSDEAITEWMNTQGLFFNTKTIFKEEPVEMDAGTNPGFVKKSKGDLSKRIDPVSTRSNQLVKNSIDLDNSVTPKSFNSDKWYIDDY